MTNQRTDQAEGMLVETVEIAGHDGDRIHAYVARPTWEGSFGAVVLMHHMPGWDELAREFARKFAHHGYLAICPDLYCRLGHGSADDVAAKARAEGGVADDQAIGDAVGAAEHLRSLPSSNGKVAVFGTCSGGRHAYLCGTRTSSFDAILDLWGGNVVMAPEDLSDKRPVAPIEYTKDLEVPLLGLFGNDDQNPSPAQVDQHEEELKRHGKQYEFHRYDDAGHGFFYYDRPGRYRDEQALDGWDRIFDFLGRTVA
jgi:carboxymethylenebutenolidase